MFKPKAESNSDMRLTAKVVITFDKPLYLGKIYRNENGIYDRSSNETQLTTTIYEFHIKADLDRYYPLIEGTPGISWGKLNLTVTGTLSGKNINETFDTLDKFDQFLLENNILPACAHKKDFCPLF